MRKGTILVVDDDEFFRVCYSDVLREGGYNVLEASCGEDALDLITEQDIDVVITDLVMPGIDGLRVLEGAKQRKALIEVIMVTGHISIESAVKALKKGAFDYISKPVNDDELLHTVNLCFEKKRLREENQEIRQSLKLFEVSWAVSKTLEEEKLHEASLDAILQIVHGDAGAFVKYDTEQKVLQVKSLRHIDKKAAAGILRLLKGCSGEELQKLRDITVISEKDCHEEKAGLGGYSDALIVPIGSASRPTGFLLVLNKKGGGHVWGTRERQRASFVAEHITIAYENARKYEAAQQLIFVDSLTNLYNSKYLHKILDKELQRSSRLKLPVSLLFIDIDNFKQVNDANDHLVGSRILVEMGANILKCVREVDTVIRYGGDEYVVILVDAGYDHALVIAERIRATVERNQFQQKEGLDIGLTVSIGVSTYPIHTRDKRELIRIADMAMFAAKDASKNCVYLAPVPGRVDD
ncbi:MAG: diguanylate cyclase [Thermodesulfobacteriota bacterium]